MRHAGEPSRTLADPSQAIDARLRKAGSDPGELRKAVATELHLAETDATCQQRTGTATTVAQVQDDVEKAVLRGHTQEADALRRLRAQALATAHRTVSTATS